MLESPHDVNLSTSRTFCIWVLLQKLDLMERNWTDDDVFNAQHNRAILISSALLQILEQVAGPVQKEESIHRWIPCPLTPR